MSIPNLIPHKTLYISGYIYSYYAFVFIFEFPEHISKHILQFHTFISRPVAYVASQRYDSGAFLAYPERYLSVPCRNIGSGNPPCDEEEVRFDLSGLQYAAPFRPVDSYRTGCEPVG